MVRALFAVVVFAWMHILAAGADTWVVAQDGSGDFVRLQDAVESAADGDLILVRAGDYGHTNIIRKGVRIVGAGVGKTILRGATLFRVVLLPSGSFASMSHCTLISTTMVHLSGGNEGRVLFTDLDLQWIPRDGNQGPGQAISVFDTRLAIGCRAFIDDSAMPDEFFDARAYSAGASIRESTVVLTQGIFPGSQSRFADSANDAYPGGAGIDSDDSEVYLAEVSGIGGKGGKAYHGGAYCHIYRPAERGGHGISVTSNSLVLSASRSEVSRFIGGEGGDGGPFIDCLPPEWFPGAVGGNGIHVESGSQLLFSGPVDYSEGPGGLGDPPGAPGVPLSGSPIWLDESIPTLTLESAAALGQELHIQLNGTPSDDFLMIASNTFDKIDLPNIGGFPLFAIPGGGMFLVWSGGKIPQGGVADMRFMLPSEDSLVGNFLIIQSLVLPRDGSTPMLTNVVADVFYYEGG